MTHVFHITHMSNLASIAARGMLSDSARSAGVFAATNIGLLHIKQRRLARVVPIAAGGGLGDYVPFNFCPRSVMLYAVHRGHADWASGQEDVLHLVSDAATLAATQRPYCFTDRHAELAHAAYSDQLANVPSLPWTSIRTNKWSTSLGAAANTKEEKQAEFLVHSYVPWSAIRGIGTIDAAREAQVRGILATLPPPHPVVAVRRDWYY